MSGAEGGGDVQDHKPQKMTFIGLSDRLSNFSVHDVTII
jgi:hypothetical protein